MSTISQISSAASAATSSTSSSSSSSSVSGQENTFLQMLTTELQNQNPLDPVDTTEFTGQLVSYSSLEQLINVNDKLDSLTSLLSGNSQLSALSYLGTTATIDSNGAALQDGQASWDYTLNSAASDVTLTVADANGNTVYTQDVGAADAGTFSLNLTSSDLPSSVSDGSALYLSVSANASDGSSVSTSVSSLVKVTGVDTSGTTTTLQAGNLSFSSDAIKSLSETT